MNISKSNIKAVSVRRLKGWGDAMLVKLQEALSEIAPISYVVFQTAQTLPYMLYGFKKRNDFHADNKHYYKRRKYWLEYYSKYAEPETVERIEGVFEGLVIPYDFEGEEYLKDQNMFISVFNFEIGESKED